MAYSVGLIGMILVKVLAPGFYARQNIRTPVKIGIFTLVLTQLMNLAFIFPLRHAGLALAIGLAACLNAGCSTTICARSHAYRPQPGWARFLVQLGAALILLAVTLWIASGDAAWWVAARGADRAIKLAWVVALGTAVYFAGLWVAGVRPRHFVKRVV